jgi:outer membrane protein assembly factor BamB
VDGLNTTLGEIQIFDDYTVVEWLELERVRGGFNDAGVVIQAAGVGLAQLLVHDSSSGAKLWGAGGASFTIRNSILYKNDRDGIGGGTNLDSITVENCTIYSNGEQGLEAISTPFTVTNTISMAHLGGDFVIGAGTQSHNMSSDATASGPGSLTFMIPANEFVSTIPGAENLHLKASAVAIDGGSDISTLFTNDVDDEIRPFGLAWDIGADEFTGAAGGGGPTVSSANNQSFTVGGPTLPAAVITITEDPTTPFITAANDLRIRIPAGFPMKFDSAQTTLFIGGPAASKVATSVTYEDLDRTVVLDVLTDFGVNDWLTVDFLRFWSFTAPAPADSLELEVGNDGVVCATDDKTLTIVPDVSPVLSSEDHQVFVQFQPPAAALPFTVSEGTSPAMGPGAQIRIRIPPSLNMVWDPGAVLSFGGPAATKLGLPAYEDSNRTLRFPVVVGFLTGDYVTVSGARFQAFGATSGPGSLDLDLGAWGDTDDKMIEIAAASDVQYLTATAKYEYVKLEWWQPAAGVCDAVLIMRRDGVEPTGPFDPMATPVSELRPCPTAGAKAFDVDTLPLSNGSLYGYGVFVEYGPATYTSGEFVMARPMDTVSTAVQWAYSTGATAMAPPGLRFSGGASYVYAVSNDYLLHSMNGDDTGGDWSPGWKPYQLGGPAQARPPVVSFPVGTALSGAAFLGSQDGNIYAVDAVNGAEVWKQPISTTLVQAAPSGYFQPISGATGLIITGTRESSLPNSLVALHKDTGAPVWSFTNSLGQGGDGKEIGIISGSASIHYPSKRAFFGSHTRGGVNGSSDTLWSVDFSSGSPMLQWSLPLGDIEGSPVVWGNAVYVGTVAGVVYAIDLITPTGTINWSYPIGDGAVKGFVFPHIGTSPLRLLVSTTGKVTSIEDLGLSSNVVWQLTPADIPGPKTPIFVPGTGKILVGSSDGNLYQVDAFSPALRTQVQLGDGGSAVGVPTVDILKSMIYVGTDEGVVYGITFPVP